MEYVNKIFNMDCIAGMSMLPDGCIDMLLTDLPYGITGCRWDSLIPFPALWAQLNRVVKADGAMVFTAAQPFTTELIQSNRKDYRYCWYWLKNQVTGFQFAKNKPLRCVEDIVVFYRRKPTYNPQGLIELTKPIKHSAKQHGPQVYRDGLDKPYTTVYTNWPRQTLSFACQREGLHPTQKPVALFEYLIKTYTNPDELVLDCCMGCGTTKRACLNASRNYVGFEIEKEMCEVALQNEE